MEPRKNGVGQSFNAPFDQPAQIATMLAIVIMLGSGVAINSILPASIISISGKIYFLIMIFFVVVGWGLTVRSYEFEEDELVISSLFGKTSIEYSKITSFELITSLSHGDIHGRAGISGVFGYRGKHNTDTHDGSFKVLCNRFDPGVLILSVDGSVFISPDKPEELCEMLSSYLADSIN